MDGPKLEKHGWPRPDNHWKYTVLGPGSENRVGPAPPSRVPTCSICHVFWVWATHVFGLLALLYLPASWGQNPGFFQAPLYNLNYNDQWEGPTKGKMCCMVSKVKMHKILSTKYKQMIHTKSTFKKTCKHVNCRQKNL